MLAETMMPIFRTQVSPMHRLECYGQSCIAPASYQLTDAAGHVVHACVRHDKFIADNASVLRAEIINVSAEVAR